jgi:isopentenyl diphosphate isomerase/L-lactate dehydrogenase-like FMN-dependent dehydrogenase
LLQGQAAPEPPGIAPRGELVNAFEFEVMAQRKLTSETYAEIAGSDHKAFDRMTFRPRMLVNTMKMDLTADLFGQALFTPILIGPASNQKRFHPEGELAMVRGAAAAQTAVVVSSRSSYPIDQIAAQAKTPLWYQVYPEADVSAVRERVQQAVKAGCKALCITLGVPEEVSRSSSPIASMDWKTIDRLREGINVPVLLKGIMSPQEAQMAVQKGVQGIIVSNYSGRAVPGMASPIEVLPSIAEAVGGKAAILIDGSFRRGSDVLKALALGAQAVLLGRPPLWGLAAYGADGVEGVLGLIQNELARDMGMCGKVNLKAIDRSLVKIHQR